MNLLPCSMSAEESPPNGLYDGIAPRNWSCSSSAVPGGRSREKPSKAKLPKPPSAHHPAPPSLEDRRPISLSAKGNVPQLEPTLKEENLGSDSVVPTRRPPPSGQGRPEGALRYGPPTPTQQGHSKKNPQKGANSLTLPRWPKAQISSKENISPCAGLARACVAKRGQSPKGQKLPLPPRHPIGHRRSRKMKISPREKSPLPFSFGLRGRGRPQLACPTRSFLTQKILRYSPSCRKKAHKLPGPGSSTSLLMKILEEWLSMVRGTEEDPALWVAGKDLGHGIGLGLG